MKTKIKSFAIDMSVTIVVAVVISLSVMASGAMDKPQKEHKSSSFQPSISFLNEYISPNNTFKI